MKPGEQVSLYLRLAPAAPSEERLRELFVSSGLTAEDADCLNAFVPMAFAHVLLPPMGVTLQKTFLVWDEATDIRVQGELEREPLFTAARRVAEQLRTGNDQDRSLFHTIASRSAEYSAATELASEGTNFSGIVLTETLLLDVPVSRVRLGPGSRFRRWLTRVRG